MCKCFYKHAYGRFSLNPMFALSTHCDEEILTSTTRGEQIRAADTVRGSVIAETVERVLGCTDRFNREGNRSQWAISGA